MQAKNVIVDDLLTDLVENIQQVFWMTDPTKLKMVYISPAYEKIWGRTCESLYSNPRSFVDAIHPEDRERIIQAFEKQIKGTYDEEYRIIQPDGQIRWIRDKAFTIRNEDDAVYRICGLAADITSQKESEEKLRRSESLLSNFFEHVPALVYVKSLDGRYLLGNTKHAQTVGKTKDEIPGLTDFDLLPAELAEQCAREDQELLKSGKPVEYEEHYRFLKRDLYHHTIKFILPDTRGNPYAICGIRTDITDKKELEKTLDEQRIKILNTSKLSALGEMAGGIAHEINTPLATIMTLSSQLEEIIAEPEIDRDLIQGMLRNIVLTTDRIAKIVKGLRSLSRDGSQDPLEHYSISQIIEDTLAFCSERFKVHGFSVRLHPIPTDLRIRCRPTEIGQVLLNLFNNAFDAVEANGTAEKWVEIKVLDSTEMLAIAIIDSGAGITPEVRQKLFQPFYTTKDVGRGTGIGLSISRRIMRDHGGELELDPQSPNTCFLIKFPKKKKVG